MSFKTYIYPNCLQKMVKDIEKLRDDPHYFEKLFWVSL